MQDSKKTSLCNGSVYESFFRIHAKSLRNFLIIKFGEKDLAEDLVQEAFIKLWENCSKVDPDTAKSFLFKVAINLGISSKRHDQVKFNYQNIIIHNKDSLDRETPEFIMEEMEFNEKVKKIISSLPDKQRQVFVLNRIEKKTYKEIAEMLGVTVKAVEKLMHKALLKIRSVIGNK